MISNNAVIKNLSITGEITTTSSRAGGIVGNMSSVSGGQHSIINCHNYANVTSSECAGGIAAISSPGSTDEKIINGCSNHGNINGVKVGGIIGYTYGSAIISNCYNTGALTGTYGVGGIVGYSNQCVVLNCYNLGNLYGTSVGGIVGANMWHESKRINCYNLAGIMDGSKIGGLIGETNCSDALLKIKNCYYDISLAENGIYNWKTDMGIALAREEIKSQDIVDEFNTYIDNGTENEEDVDPSEWKRWKLDENGYPVFE